RWGLLAACPRVIEELFPAACHVTAYATEHLPGLVSPLDQRSGVLPGLTAAAVLLDGDDAGVLGHPVGVEHAGQVVDFVGDEPCYAAFERGDVGAAVCVLVHDLDGEWPGYCVAHVKEAQASLVLFVLLAEVVDDLRVQQRDGLPARGADNSA